MTALTLAVRALSIIPRAYWNTGTVASAGGFRVLVVRVPRVEWYIAALHEMAETWTHNR